jgi:hypothetical protein
MGMYRRRGIAGHGAQRIQAGDAARVTNQYRKRSAIMTEIAKLLTDQPVGEVKPGPTAAQKALLERKVLPLNSLVHGNYYNGLLDDMTTTARWHEQRRRFVFWIHNMGEPKLKAAPHVADLGTGARFAPLSRLESEGGNHISDFAFETTR